MSRLPNFSEWWPHRPKKPPRASGSMKQNHWKGSSYCHELSRFRSDQIPGTHQTPLRARGCIVQAPINRIGALLQIRITSSYGDAPNGYHRSSRLAPCRIFLPHGKQTRLLGHLVERDGIQPLFDHNLPRAIDRGREGPDSHTPMLVAATRSTASKTALTLCYIEWYKIIVYGRC